MDKEEESGKIARPSPLIIKVYCSLYYEEWRKKKKTQYVCVNFPLRTKSKGYSGDFLLGLVSLQPCSVQVEKTQQWLIAINYASPPRPCPLKSTLLWVHMAFGVPWEWTQLKHRIWISGVARRKHSKLSRSGCQCAEARSGPEPPDGDGPPGCHWLTWLPGRGGWWEVWTVDLKTVKDGFN